MPNYHRSDDECHAFKARGLSHYHIVRLNDRLMSEGRTDRNREFPYLGLNEQNFENRHVLDVGALDGVLSFNAERAGAGRVLAIDVEDPELQDWGWRGPSKKFRSHGEVKRRVFDELHTFFDSDVEREQRTVYQLHPDTNGQFDIVFFYGVLYHLRHPLLALDRLRAVCRGAICLETHISNRDPLLPSSLFYRDDVLDDADSNWTGPSESCVASWMMDSGFLRVYAERKALQRGRQRFVGFVGEPTFDINNENFRELDADYFAKVRERCEQELKVTLR